MNTIDLLGASCSLLSTYYFIRISNKAWLAGLIATGINGWLYWHKGIYADMVLEALFALGMGYGWYRWKANKKTQTAPVQLNELSFYQWLTLLAVFIATLITIYSTLIVYTDSSIAFLDAITVTLSLTAQWLMCQKNIFTWVLWFITDALYACIYLSKGLPFHSALMMFYLILAIVGYLNWSKNLPSLALTKKDSIVKGLLRRFTLKFSQTRRMRFPSEK